MAESDSAVTGPSPVPKPDPEYRYSVVLFELREAIYQTRHEAVGAAARSARRHRERRKEMTGVNPEISVQEAAQEVEPLLVLDCPYCGADILESQKWRHDPCPVWKADGHPVATDQVTVKD